MNQYRDAQGLGMSPVTVATQVLHYRSEVLHVRSYEFHCSDHARY